MKSTKKLSASLEDYLETILILERKNRVARVKDISERLDVKMPSVTGALKHLREEGMIEYEKNSFITLTEEGMKAAERILDRHNILMRFFTECLKIEGNWVEDQACMIEHSINHETATRLSKLTDWIKKTVFEEMKISENEWNDLLSKN